MSDRHYVHHEDDVALAKILKESKPWFEQYGTTIIYGVAAVLAVSAVVVYISRRPPATAGESSGLLMAATLEDYKNVADSVPNSPIGVVARVRQAELSLGQAVGQLFTDREKSAKSLDDAAGTFEALADRKDLPADLRERVLAGVARTLECRCDGTDSTARAAIEAWEQLLKEFPDSKMFKDIAESRVKALKSEKAKAFYAWFKTQNPKPGDDLLLPQDGPGKVPDIPGMPKIDLPDLTSPIVPTEGAKTETPAAPAEGTPAEGTPAAEAKPAPAEGTPAPEAKPAEGTPAPEEKPAEGAPAPAEGTPAPEKSGE